MNMKKEIIVFTEGDSLSPDTWSNVPYFLTKSMEELGVDVHRVDIGLSTSNVIEKIIVLVIKIFIRLFKIIDKSSNPGLGINRTFFYKKMVERKMKKAIKKFPNANIVSMNFSHCGKKFAKNQITCMLCDWTIEYLIEVQQNRKPGFFEKIAIKRQKKEITTSDYVITLFPDVQEYMEKKYKRKILYLGNVINSDLIKFPETETIKQKFSGNRYLFIGRKKYIQSAIGLVNIVKKYNKNNEDKVYVDIIGLNEDDDKTFKSSYVTCWGYLSKGNEQEKRCYYEKILRAKAIVNTTPIWNGMSSLIETMYYDTPIIIIPNPNFIKTFGEVCDFGYYCKSGDDIELINVLEKFQKLTLDDYSRMCIQSHKKVESFTWENYVKKILELLC